MAQPLMHGYHQRTRQHPNQTSNLEIRVAGPQLNLEIHEPRTKPSKFVAISQIHHIARHDVYLLSYM